MSRQEKYETITEYAVFILCALILTVVVFIFYYGSKGIPAYNELNIQIEQIQKHIETLSYTNTHLNTLRDALEQKDREIIKVYAQKLGFGSAEDRFFRFIGFMGTPDSSFDAGTALKVEKPIFYLDTQKKIQLIFIMVAIVVLGIVLLHRELHTRRNRT
ncbi:MAG: septum formation initiator family protein [Treponema sp.]|jgi:cell division protein FtsB|nr:septum formation initiator family protein [Treponema sp.]